MKLENLHKIQCVGYMANPLYYCKLTGKVYRHVIWHRKGKITHTQTREIIAKDNFGYRIVSLHGKTTRIHTIIAMEFLSHVRPGTTGNGLVVDHINGNKLDNRVENLQLVTIRVNTLKGKQEKGKMGSVPQNIYWRENKQKYRVLFQFFGKSISFGEYTTLEDALKARTEVQKRLIINREPLGTFKSEYVSAKRFSLGSVIK